MNDLKNRALKLGANYIHLVVNRAGVTGSVGGSSYSGTGLMSGSTEQTNVTNVGNAYICPKNAIGL